MENKTDNELIAEFMGGSIVEYTSYHEKLTGWVNTPANGSAHYAQSHEFRYHSCAEYQEAVSEALKSGEIVNPEVFPSFGCADGRDTTRVHFHNDERFVDLKDGDTFDLPGECGFEEIVQVYTDGALWRNENDYTKQFDLTRRNVICLMPYPESLPEKPVQVEESHKELHELIKLQAQMAILVRLEAACGRMKILNCNKWIEIDDYRAGLQIAIDLLKNRVHH